MYWLEILNYRVSGRKTTSIVSPHTQTINTNIFEQMIYIHKNIKFQESNINYSYPTYDEILQ
jgi:hypothetical protein